MLKQKAQTRRGGGNVERNASREDLHLDRATLRTFSLPPDLVPCDLRVFADMLCPSTEQ